LAAVAIEPGPTAQGQGGVNAAMAHGQLGQQWYAQVGTAFPQHLLEAKTRPFIVFWLLTIAEAAKGEAGQLL
jgi:hypothetical protein